MGTDRTLVTVGDQVFRWSILRQPQWCGADGWKGLALSVEALESPGRKLVIQLPFATTDHRSTPHKQRPTVTAADLERYIGLAIAGGWSPESRGKPFLFEVTDDA